MYPSCSLPNIKKTFPDVFFTAILYSVTQTTPKSSGRLRMLFSFVHVHLDRLNLQTTFLINRGFLMFWVIRVKWQGATFKPYSTSWATCFKAWHFLQSQQMVSHGYSSGHVKTMVKDLICHQESMTETFVVSRATEPFFSLLHWAAIRRLRSGLVSEPLTVGRSLVPLIHLVFCVVTPLVLVSLILTVQSSLRERIFRYRMGTYS